MSLPQVPVAAVGVGRARLIPVEPGCAEVEASCALRPAPPWKYTSQSADCKPNGRGVSGKRPQSKRPGTARTRGLNIPDAPRL